LLAPALRPGIRRVSNFDDELVRRTGCIQAIRYIESERRIAAAMNADRRSVHFDASFPIHSPEMKEKAPA
jgi:hypothetical protein